MLTCGLTSECGCDNCRRRDTVHKAEFKGTECEDRCLTGSGTGHDIGWLVRVGADGFILLRVQPVGSKFGHSCLNKGYELVISKHLVPAMVRGMSHSAWLSESGISRLLGSGRTCRGHHRIWSRMEISAAMISQTRRG